MSAGADDLPPGKAADVGDRPRKVKHLKTAETLGLMIPLSILARADEVIE